MVKYNDISEKLVYTLNDLKMSKDSLKNMSKHIKRRENVMSKQSETIKENEKEIEQVKEDCLRKDEEKEKEVSVAEDLKQEKRNVLVKVCRLRKVRETEDCVLLNNIESEIINLKYVLQKKEDQVSELEQLNSMLENPKNFGIFPKFVTLTAEYGVSQKKVNGVIETVISNLTNKSLSNLPSIVLKFRYM